VWYNINVAGFRDGWALFLPRKAFFVAVFLRVPDVSDKDSTGIPSGAENGFCENKKE
jgi:hypothetical protein